MAPPPDEAPKTFSRQFFLSADYLWRRPRVFDALLAGGAEVMSVLGPLVNGRLAARRLLRASGVRASTDARDQLWHGLAEQYPRIAEVTGWWLVFTDGDEHRRLRALVSDIVEASFGRDMVAAFTSRLRARLDGSAPELDIDRDLVTPAIEPVVARHFGDGHAVQPQVAELASLVDALLDAMVRARQLEAAEELCRHVARDEAAVRATLAASVNPVVRQLATGAFDGDGTPGVEAVVGMLAFLIAASTETTKAFIIELVRLLARDDVWATVRDRRSSRDALLNEALRLASPVQVVARTGRRDGEVVFVNLAAANRDPSAYPAPHDVRLDGGRPPHIAFGHGAHYCVGAMTARAMGAAFVDAVLEQGVQPTVVDTGRPVYRLFMFRRESFRAAFGTKPLVREGTP